MKARLLIDCPGERYHKGEIGEVLENDSDKYDCCLLLQGTPEVELLGKVLKMKRIFYFYKEEVELLKDVDAPEGGISCQN